MNRNAFATRNNKKKFSRCQPLIDEGMMDLAISRGKAFTFTKRLSVKIRLICERGYLNVKTNLELRKERNREKRMTTIIFDGRWRFRRMWGGGIECSLPGLQLVPGSQVRYLFQNKNKMEFSRVE